MTPRPLGPLVDIVEQTGGELEQLVEDGAKPHVLLGAFLRELGVRRPTVAVLEDVHWADEATLDLLSLLGRRIEATPALVVATFRDDELGRAHPLRIVLGDLATCSAVGRQRLQPLSQDAVRELAAPRSVDPEELYRKTAGNPFFVAEVLAAGAADIPATVRDAVLARAARLSPAARDLLDPVAVVPARAELWLLEAVAAERLSRLAECLASGMLVEEHGLVGFRHELARLAVEESIAPQRRVALHRAVLRALAAPPGGAPDLARLSHHAEQAGDAEAVLEYSPAAGARAAHLSSHREAATQYGRALRFADTLGLSERADLLERRSLECYLSAEQEDGLEARQRALDCYRELGDRRKEGDQLRWLSRVLWMLGRNPEAEDVGREAVEVLEQLPPGHELGLAYGNLAQLFALTQNTDGALLWGRRALALGERLDDTEVLVQALIYVGVAEQRAGSNDGTAKLERSLELALGAGLEMHAARAFINLGAVALMMRRYARADRYLDAGIEYCVEHDIELGRLNMVANRARSDLDQGRWTEAADRAAEALRQPRTPLVARPTLLIVLGLVRARRGDPECWPPLDEALELALPTGELQQIAPVAAARAEAHWLDGDPKAVREETDAALELAGRLRDPSTVGELACWRRRAGIAEEAPADAAEPFALELKGEWARAAGQWTEFGCPYEAALALAAADDEETLRRSFSELQRLDARPAAAIVARQLRERGVRGLKRGPRPASRQNPADLTPRELEVLTLVSQGLRNREIADRLFLSAKTVDHHVSAILQKLGVASRGQAAAEATRLGLLAEEG